MPSGQPLTLIGISTDRHVTEMLQRTSSETCFYDYAVAQGGRVWVLELLGSEKLVEVSYGDRSRLTVQARADTHVNVDELVGVHLDPKRIHLFDPSSGTALVAKPPVGAER